MMVLRERPRRNGKFLRFGCPDRYTPRETSEKLIGGTSTLGVLPVVFEAFSVIVPAMVAQSTDTRSKRHMSLVT